MIVPSIDIQSGQTVQLVGGKELAIEAGDPVPWAKKFSRVGEVAVIDLDAAMGTGTNRQTIEDLLRLARCRVGGGIRDLETALSWLDAGAAKIIIGTAAEVNLLSQLPKQRVIVALDAVHENGVGTIVDHGWQKDTGRTVIDRIHELRDHVGGFLITFVENEGQLTGIDLDLVQHYVDAAAGTKLTIAGGVRSAEEVAALDAIGVDAQVGMAIYTGKISLSECFCSPLTSDRPDGLWPTVVCNMRGQSLGLAYSNLHSISASIETGSAHYWSRKRGLWNKGAKSGNWQELLDIQLDCDRDTIKFTVRQQGEGFCHLRQPSCFGNIAGLTQLEQTLAERIQSAPDGSYTRKLLDSETMLDAKIREEGNELADATTDQQIIHESADVLYFLLTKLAKHEISLSAVELELDRRTLKVSRRKGDVKKEFCQ